MLGGGTVVSRLIESIAVDLFRQLISMDRHRPRALRSFAELSITE